MVATQPRSQGFFPGLGIGSGKRPWERGWVATVGLNVGTIFKYSIKLSNCGNLAGGFCDPLSLSISKLDKNLACILLRVLIKCHKFIKPQNNFIIKIKYIEISKIKTKYIPWLH